ncbi:DUF2959 domain-containing protein [Algicola sagamiensis]|uniref:DUF2959 domain-containing protein n=1 Tax=Algicola sagamiensis TaxID=163869 RepID=UPI000477C3DF|nr:DUF2959 domain-containing protein [Algicola sagamiensis]
MTYYKYTLILFLSFILFGCQQVYYNTLEKVGIHKRDILVDRIEQVQEAQKESQEEFQSALEQLSGLIAFEGGELEAFYEKLKGEYDDAKQAAGVVTKRINSVEQVAEDLFEEWEEELGQYRNATLRSKSQQKLNTTKRRFKKLLKGMRKSEKSMQPVLTALNDQTLYLKHNLNAQAIGAIKGEFKKLKTDINTLIRSMNHSIQEASTFISEIEK